jgi:hypothetical protein
LARTFHDAAQGVDGVELDYSVESLGWVDGFLQVHHDAGRTADDFAESVFTAGCYVGEVMCRHAGGRWVDRDTLDPRGAGRLNMPILVALPGETVANPVGKVFKRFEGDSGDNLLYFYRVMTRESTPNGD